MKQEVKQGQTDYTVLILIRDTAGAPKTGLVFNSAGIDVCYTRVETDNDVVLTAGAPVDLATPALTDPHLDWGFLQIDATNAPGVYRLDLPDGVFASGAWSAIVSLICTGCDPTHIEFILVPSLPYNGVDVYSVGGTAQTANDNGADINAILTDTNELQTNQGNWTTAVSTTCSDKTGFSLSAAGNTAVIDDFETQSAADPTGFKVNVMEVNGTGQTANDNGADINAILTDTGSTLDTLIKDIPTNAEFALRTLVAANYVVVGDTIAGVTAVTNDVGITQAGADKAWGTAARVLTAGTNLNDISTAQVNAQVADVLKTDTLGEPAQGAPGATLSIESKIAYIYKWLRNKITNDGTDIKVYNDAGAVVDHKAPVSEAAGTVTRGEFVTGP